ncbi:MAG: Uncharacterized protein YjqA, partial [uncultured Rubrobacteraceae bacterium]
GAARRIDGERVGDRAGEDRGRLRPGAGGRRAHREGVPVAQGPLRLHEQAADPGGQAGPDGQQGRVPLAALQEHHALQRRDRRPLRPGRGAEGLDLRQPRAHPEALQQATEHLRRPERPRRLRARL